MNNAVFDWFFGKKHEKGALFISLSHASSYRRTYEMAMNQLIPPYQPAAKTDSYLNLNKSQFQKQAAKAALTQAQEIEFTQDIGPDHLLLLQKTPCESLRAGEQNSNAPYVINFFPDQNEILFLREAHLSDAVLLNQVVQKESRFLHLFTLDPSIQMAQWYSIVHSPDLSGFGPSYTARIAGEGQDQKSLLEFLQS